MGEAMAEIGIFEFKDVQNSILKLLEEMSDKIEDLPQSDKLTIECKAKALQDCVKKAEDVISKLGENFTDAEIPIDMFQKIRFNMLFPNNDIGYHDKQGAFGKVFICKFLSQKVAVKIFELDKKDSMQKEKQLKSFQSEVGTLRKITHENIIGFRGWGEHEDIVYLVMEHLDKNLFDYVQEQKSHEDKGLSSRITWAMAKQIAQALLYLHSVNIAHADLKPDNILVDTRLIIPKPKICDFGHARQEFHKSLRKGHVKYLPKNEEVKGVGSMEDIFMLDVYSFGLVILYIRTADPPSFNMLTDEYLRVCEKSSEKLSPPLKEQNGIYIIHEVNLPPGLPETVLGELIISCCSEKECRPTFEQIKDKYFAADMENPFNLSQNSKFFEYGFLKDTQIFVAHTIVNDSKETIGQGALGYTSDNLICSVKVNEASDNDKPSEKVLSDLYEKHKATFDEKAKKKEIDNNPMIALENLQIYQSANDENKRIELRFQHKTYCHHRAMREIWRSFGLAQKEKAVPCLSIVNPLYSNSFGLHVAVLTNEGPQRRKKFVFTERSHNKGVASPGSYTCGAVESCSVKDFLNFDEIKELKLETKNKLQYISLLSTAARGLKEKLGLPLHGKEKKAIVLNTVYLKFDNHEWGMCGFVDLTRNEIEEQNRFSFEKLSAAFTSAPRDKFEHSKIHGVDFDLAKMVDWIRKNHNKLASSAKIVVVKVLQAFFGVEAVADEFAKKM